MSPSERASSVELTASNPAASPRLARYVLPSLRVQFSLSVARTELCVARRDVCVERFDRAGLEEVAAVGDERIAQLPACALDGVLIEDRQSGPE